MSLKNLLGRFGPIQGPLMNPSGQPEESPGGIPDLVEPLQGWRVWKVWIPAAGSDSLPVLSSVILDMPWTPRRKVAAEHSFDLGSSCRGLLESGCSCGLYAFKDPADAFGYLVKIRDRLPGMSVDVSFGAVSLWGRVIECEKGYKAQYAYPQHLYLPAPASRLLDQISSSFGVPVGIYASSCDDEISLTVSNDCQGREKLPLKNTGEIAVRNMPYPVGLYDLTASPDWMDRFPSVKPENVSFGPPAREEPRDRRYP